MSEVPKGKEITGAITKHLDQSYMSALDLIGSESGIVVTIDRVEKHDLLRFNNGNTEANALLLYVEESERPLLLKPCHIKGDKKIKGTSGIIQETGTAIVKNWKGKKITLYAAEGTWFGEAGVAIRVKNTKGKA